MKPALLLMVIATAFGEASCHKEAKIVPIDFATQIKPLFESRCIDCHHSGALFGNLNLGNRTLAFNARPTGPAITPGQPEMSPLYTVLTQPESEPKAMPPTGHKISDQDVEVVKRWIQQGARWPDGAEGAIKPVPLGKPEI